MQLNELLFSSRPIHRFYRHTFFWMLCFLFLLLTNIISIYLQFDFIARHLVWGIIPRLLSSMLFMILYTYLLVYWIMPLFKRYIKELVLKILLGSLLIFSLMIIKWGGERLMGIEKLQWNAGIFYWWGLFWEFVSYGPVAACVVLVLGRQIIQCFEQIHARNQLVKEKVKAELRLLSSQVHPHFLFNALNLIYSQALRGASQTAETVGNLHQMMTYMLDDCDAEFIDLHKELAFIRNYILLGSERYGQRLTIDANICGDPNNKLISPMLLLPFVENSFKHGPAFSRGAQWIRINLHIEEDTLHVEIVNSYNGNNIQSDSGRGIGLANVKKRLELMYHGLYELEMESSPAIYAVKLNLKLFKPLSYAI